MKDFFISYNKADRAWAEWIAWQLEEAGHTTTLQAWDFRPGSNFVVDMDRAAVEGERTIAVLSPDYLSASFTQPEWAAAFKRDPTGEKGLLLPVRVRDCDIEGLLGQIVYIDLLKLDEAAAKRSLLDGVKRGRAKPESVPDFPGASLSATSSKPRFPGAMPSIWNVPHLRNPNFTGREDELAELRASLLAGETAALVQAQAIHGLGGVGKTQLAVEYIIVTSRNPTWTGVARPLSVKPLPLEEAIEFLLKRTGHKDETTAKLLAEALGCLPLALEQAGAYIETSGCTMPHYLELFDKR
jgi:hypothetical protein